MSVVLIMRAVFEIRQTVITLVSVQVVDDIARWPFAEERFSHEGQFYRTDAAICAPKPIATPRPRVYAGGESEAAKSMIARDCDSYVMHGDPPEVIAGKIAVMRARRAALGLPPMTFGMAGYAIVRDTEAEAQAELARITTLTGEPPAGYANFDQWLSGTQLERDFQVQEYSVSNRGLRAGLVGTPAQVMARIADYEAAGVDLLLLQMSPQDSEMARFAETVIAPWRAAR